MSIHRAVVSLLDTPRAVRDMLRVGPLAQVARRAEALLTDSRRTELVAVALPEELPINETIELVRRSNAVGVPCRTVFVNQVPAQPVDAADRALLDIIHRDNEGALGRIAGAARNECEAVDLARVQVDRLRAAVQVQIIEVARYAAQDPRQCVSQLVEALSR